jgi:hypothetical protein
MARTKLRIRVPKNLSRKTAREALRILTHELGVAKREPWEKVKSG